MTRMIFAGVAALAPLAFGLQSAAAYDAPWCAVTKDGDHWDCQYLSFEDCRPKRGGRQPWLVQSEPILRRPVRR